MKHTTSEHGTGVDAPWGTRRDRTCPHRGGWRPRSRGFAREWDEYVTAYAPNIGAGIDTWACDGGERPDRERSGMRVYVPGPFRPHGDNDPDDTWDGPVWWLVTRERGTMRTERLFMNATDANAWACYAFARAGGTVTVYECAGSYVNPVEWYVHRTYREYGIGA